MAIDNYKVSTTEVNTYNVKSAPDVLTSDAQTNKNWFDRLGEYFISKYNSLIDYLANNLTGRDGTEDTIYTKSYIGTDGEDGISVTVQSVEKHDTTTTIKLVDSDGNTPPNIHLQLHSTGASKFGCSMSGISVYMDAVQICSYDI